MISATVFEELKRYVPKENIKREEPLKLYTTFRVGGPAECLIEIETRQQLCDLLKYLKTIEHPYFILGNGSNLLVSDHGYEGVVLRIGSKMSDFRVEGTRLFVQAGALMSQTARFAMENGLSGLEFASGIPGTIGGGMIMNAGAYGGEFSQITENVTVLDEHGELMVLDHETMEFGYRTSAVKNRPFVVVEATLNLDKADREEIKARMMELSKKRKEKQPLDFPSAGSTFKRPEGNFAGKLIMEAGLRGFTIGDAMVSEKHCGFIINRGNASAEDVHRLIQTVREKVYENSGVRLEPEVIELGEF